MICIDSAIHAFVAPSFTRLPCTKPAQLWTYVKSTTHNAFGRLTRNSRFTLSSGHGALGLLTVVTQVFPRLTPAKPMARISRSIVHLATVRSEEHTSELQSLMRISYAVFCLKKKKKN